MVSKINEKWKEFVKPGNCKTDKVYRIVKIHKIDNPVCLITSGCNTVVKKPIYYS